MDKDLEKAIKFKQILNNAADLLTDARNEMVKAITETMTMLLGDEDECDGDNAVLFNEEFDVASCEPITGLTRYSDGSINTDCDSEVGIMELEELSANELETICLKLREGEFTTCINPIV